MKNLSKFWLTVAGIILAYAFFLGYATFIDKNEFTEAPTIIEGCKDSNIAGIVYSLKNYPLNWETTEYELTHDNGITIWIANEDYGLKIGTDGESGDYEMSDQCRAILYDATQSWQRNYISEYLR